MNLDRYAIPAAVVFSIAVLVVVFFASSGAIEFLTNIFGG